MFREDYRLAERRRAAVEALGERHLIHPINSIQRQTEPPLTAERLITYYRRQDPTMQGGLRAFWRTLVSVPHVGREFDRALAILSHEANHA